ncbi:MAG: 4-alpha-glucanotransferase [Bdellovibrionales bacterium]|nr:4-alpha-glucanotransferase [Bdellovibrionales bacterium]
MPLSSHLLRRAARLWGVQPSYRANTGEWVWAEEDPLAAVLAAVSGHSVGSDADLNHLIRERFRRERARGVEPVITVWQGEPASFLIHGEYGRAHLRIDLEHGGSETRELDLAWFRKRQGLHTVPLPQLPLGYHTLELAAEGKTLRSLVIVAPARLERLAGMNRSWGPFLPFYALRSERDWGVGSFSEVAQAMDLLRPYGARFVSSLPLLAGNFERPECDPSPYSALTRLFWNEIYLDVEAVAKRRNAPSALAVLQDPVLREKIRALRGEPLVDFHRAWELKAEVLRAAAQDFFDSGADAGYEKFLADNPDADAYAEFRGSRNLHLFAQYETTLALRSLRDHGAELYLDFPVGVSEAGFDFQRYRNHFLAEVTVGAPPEPVFRLGQNWGFPALHPDRMREEGYSYLRRSLQNQFRYARLLRIDHVMGLHRVYAIPKGRSGQDGVYLRFQPQELFAVACLEAHRHGADIIGENLGTVPEAVQEILDRRNFNGMWIFEEAAERGPGKNLIRPNTLVAPNNHDMAAFPAFAKGADLDLVEKLGILSHAQKEEQALRRRTALSSWEKFFGAKDLLSQVIAFLAQSPAAYLVVNPEDLWGEESPQNVPGTFREVPNWKRKFRVPLGEWTSMPLVSSTLRLLKSIRP